MVQQIVRHYFRLLQHLEWQRIDFSNKFFRNNSAVASDNVNELNLLRQLYPNAGPEFVDDDQINLEYAFRMLQICFKTVTRELESPDNNWTRDDYFTLARFNIRYARFVLQRKSGALFTVQIDIIRWQYRSCPELLQGAYDDSLSEYLYLLDKDEVNIWIKVQLFMLVFMKQGFDRQWLQGFLSQPKRNFFILALINSPASSYPHYNWLHQQAIYFLKPNNWGNEILIKIKKIEPVSSDVNLADVKEVLCQPLIVWIELFNNGKILNESLVAFLRSIEEYLGYIVKRARPIYKDDKPDKNNPDTYTLAARYLEPRKLEDRKIKSDYSVSKLVKILMRPSIRMSDFTLLGFLLQLVYLKLEIAGKISKSIDRYFVDAVEILFQWIYNKLTGQDGQMKVLDKSICNNFLMLHIVGYKSGFENQLAMFPIITLPIGRILFLFFYNADENVLIEFCNTKPAFKDCIKSFDRLLEELEKELAKEFEGELGKGERLPGDKEIEKPKPREAFYANKPALRAMLLDPSPASSKPDEEVGEIKGPFPEMLSEHEAPKAKSRETTGKKTVTFNMFSQARQTDRAISDTDPDKCAAIYSEYQVETQKGDSNNSETRECTI